MYSFLEQAKKGLDMKFHIKGLNLSKVMNVAALVVGAFHHSEQASNEAAAGGAEKPSGADKKAVADAVLAKGLPFIEALVGDRFNDAKVQATKDDLYAALAAFQKAIIDAKEIPNKSSDAPLSSPAAGTSIADAPVDRDGTVPVSGETLL